MAEFMAEKVTTIPVADGFLEGLEWRWICIIEEKRGYGYVDGRCY
jgi:hypothetical protein